MARFKLLVEGSDDRDFCKSYCDVLGLNNVEVFPPKVLDIATGNGWSNLVTNLPLLLKQIKAGDIDNVGIVLDADFSPDNNGGFTQRRKFVADVLVAFGYVIPPEPKVNLGEIFVHSDGLPPIGLWLMPDHQNDGMLENFVEGMISDVTQVNLLSHVEQAIQTLPTTLFNKKLHLAKAKVLTWRAWQKPPGNSLSNALKDGILDKSKSVNFENWLTQVFK